MADVELVIKIPEEMYKWVDDVNKFFNYYGTSDFVDLVKKGTPLPKKHGRLIDADELRCERKDFDTYFDYSNMFDEIYNAPTIIEADKESENG